VSTLPLLTLLANLGLGSLALPILVLNATFLVECLTAILGGEPKSSSAPIPSDCQLAILIPAHNEAAVLAQTLDQIRPQLRSTDRLLVIADNCDDNTAQIARDGGAEAIERQSDNKRGKGYALDYGLQVLGQDRTPTVVIIIDADCSVSPTAIAQLTHQVLRSNRPVQACYLMTLPAKANLKTRVSSFSARVKNFVRLYGLERLGLPGLLTGTGMAFPWAALQSVDLASGHIAEDMKLGMDLAIAGYPPAFCPAALVSADLPQNDQAATSQRTRWEHGRLQVFTTYVPLLLKQALTQRRLDLAIMALDLAIPPLTLLVALWAAVAIASAAAAILAQAWVGAEISVISGLCLAIAVLGSWLRFGQADISIGQLLTVPLYMLWKVPIYLKFLTKPQQAWVRTDRDAKSSVD
jgi:cellulose synthase/poly-beta-1,6-N-acetylglucosamine synthase-like glycosyltransferase